MQNDSQWIRQPEDDLKLPEAMSPDEWIDMVCGTTEDDEDTQPIIVPPLPPHDVDVVKAALRSMESGGSRFSHTTLLDVLGIFPVHALAAIHAQGSRR